MDKKIDVLLEKTQQRVLRALETRLPAASQTPQRLHQAMRYAVFNGGKRLRPAWVYATGKMFAADAATLDQIACAVECIHAFSLVHDDLPAMDNDVLRRGQPTCHIAFDEATALLAGDALQSLAFECLSHTSMHLVGILAQAVGSRGMAGGQMIDIASIDKQLTLAELIHMHHCKTGALIRAAVLMGASACEGASENERAHLAIYAEKSGLAFQVQDDILDVESATAVLGKTAGKDAAHLKPTFVSLLGLGDAKGYVLDLYVEAVEALEIFNERADDLRTLAKFAVERKY